MAGGPTPPEEIARQHSDAMKLIQSSSPCVPITGSDDEIPLSTKRRPTSSSEPVRSEAEDGAKDGGREGGGTVAGTATMERKEAAARSCVSSRAVVDVSELASLVDEGHNDPAPPPPPSNGKNKGGSPKREEKKDEGEGELPSSSSSSTNLWDPRNAARSNVAVTRPSHDAWGIKKIVLIFCDDFLRTVYEMPWYHLNGKMREAVRPILDALNVPRERIVRMLLAALPPGVTIPVHADSGEWVFHCHRVHVPVIVADPSTILFRVGVDEDRMERVDCAPGHVFEIDNASSHAVSNCHLTDHRVHLILDYVNPAFVVNRRIELDPGETLVQTRRSVDRLIDARSRPTPSYLILGAQKAGTTSLYNYLNQHPLVARARRRETHCLDWRWDGSLRTTRERKRHCLTFYHAKELARHPSILTGDSTPSYLLDSVRVVPRLKEVFPHPMRFFVMARDPTKRAYSHYCMVTALDGTPEQVKHRGTEWLDLTFEEAVDNDMKNMKDAGLMPYWNVDSHEIDAELFERFVGSDEENEAWEKYLTSHVPQSTGSHSLVSRGLYELNLRNWFEAFPPDRFLVLKLEDMAKPDGVRTVMAKAWDHLGLPPYEVKDDAPKNARQYEPMKEETKVMLRKFYDPHNRRLGAMLGEDWKDPWPLDG